MLVAVLEIPFATVAEVGFLASRSSSSKNGRGIFSPPERRADRIGEYQGDLSRDLLSDEGFRPALEHR